MADAQTIRAEIKSWERAFKAKHQRNPTVQDIKDNPEIAAKYKLHKKLNKSFQEDGQRESKQFIPRTPSPKPNPCRHPSSILPKAAAIHSGSQSDANPFSPTKKRPVASSSKRLLRDEHDEIRMDDSHLDGRVAAVSLSRMHLQPDKQDAPNGTQSLAVVSKARKRLRGDPVSPSPNRPEKKARRRPESNSPPASPTRAGVVGDTQDNFEGAELSFFDESPVKPSSGKDFKSLFDEAEKPLPRLLFQPIPESKQGTGDVSLVPAGGPSRLSKADKKVGQKLQSKLPTFGILNGNSRHKFENTLNAPERDQTAVKSNELARKRPASPVDEEASVARTSPSGEMLLPPSPTIAAQRGPKSAKGFASNRKKAKTKGVTEDIADSESEDANNALHVIDLDMKDLRRRGLQESSRDDGDIEDDELMLSIRKLDSRVNSDQSSDDETKLDINLPEDMREYLHISPSRARERDEGEIVDFVLQGSRRSARIIKGEVWGVGEMGNELEDGAHTEGDDDWDGEGLPWEAAELSDFEGNV